MDGQMHILEYLGNEEINYIKSLACWLKAWDGIWNMGYLEKLKNEKTLSMFYQTFGNREAHYFKINGNMYETDGKEVYGAKIDKKEDVLRIYKCGNESENIIATEPVEKLLDKLVQG